MRKKIKIWVILIILIICMTIGELVVYAENTTNLDLNNDGTWEIGESDSWKNISFTFTLKDKTSDKLSTYHNKNGLYCFDRNTNLNVGDTKYEITNYNFLFREIEYGYNTDIFNMYRYVIAHENSTDNIVGKAYSNSAKRKATNLAIWLIQIYGNSAEINKEEAAKELFPNCSLNDDLECSKSVGHGGSLGCINYCGDGVWNAGWNLYDGARNYLKWANTNHDVYSDIEVSKVEDKYYVSYNFGNEDSKKLFEYVEIGGKKIENGKKIEMSFEELGGKIEGDSVDWNFEVKYSETYYDGWAIKFEQKGHILQTMLLGRAKEYNKTYTYKKQEKLETVCISVQKYIYAIGEEKNDEYNEKQIGKDNGYYLLR